MTGRISVWQPWWFHGVFAAHSSASSRSRTSRTMKPPSCSLVSMNGPSVIWRRPPSIRTVVAACEPSRPSQAISTPAARAASSNACHAAISRAPSSAENASAARSSPYNVSSTFMSHLRLVSIIQGTIEPRILDSGDAPTLSWDLHAQRVADQLAGRDERVVVRLGERADLHSLHEHPRAVEHDRDVQAIRGFERALRADAVEHGTGAVVELHVDPGPVVG